MNEFLDRFSEDGEFSLGDLLSEYFEISETDAEVPKIKF